VGQSDGRGVAKYMGEMDVTFFQGSTNCVHVQGSEDELSESVEEIFFSTKSSQSGSREVGGSGVVFWSRPESEG
jgi:hypothetical protein